MIKMIMLAAVVLALSGCDGAGNDLDPSETYKTIEIQGHEYIFISRRPYSAEMAMAHNENCKAH